MSKKYSVVVVGLGKRGGHHVSAFQASDRFEVRGICDIDEERLRTSEIVAHELAVELGACPTIESSTDRRAALDGPPSLRSRLARGFDDYGFIPRSRSHS